MRAVLASLVLLCAACSAEDPAAEKDLASSETIPEFRIPRPATDEGLAWKVIEVMWEHADFYGDESTWETSIASATPGQLAIYACTWYDREVRNGGHHQFFGNGTGMIWKEALAGFELLGAKEHRRTLGKAITGFPDSRPARDRGRREVQLDRVDRAALSRLDDEYYDLKEDFEALVRAYILAHPQEFFLDR